MNQFALFCFTVIFLVGCSSNLVHDRSPSSNIQKASVVLVGPAGGVILFIKINDEVIIKKCANYTVVDSPDKCEIADNSRVQKVAVAKFRNHLRSALLLHKFEPSDKSERTSVDSYRKAVAKSDPAVDVEQLRAQKERIEKFLRTYCKSIAEDNKCAKDNNVAKLKALTAKLVSLKDLEASTADINAILNKLIDVTIGEEAVTPYRSSDNDGSIVYEVLRSYVQPFAADFSNFVTVSAGSFVMGSPDSDPLRDGDEKQVQVQISKDYELESTEVSQFQWWAIMGNHPSRYSNQTDCPDSYNADSHTCADFPVESVSFDDVHVFLDKLNSQDLQYQYRLPTEAEWEYAAHAGTSSVYASGDDASEQVKYAWFTENSAGKTHPVATLKANQWDFYDMEGNVWEWVESRYESDRTTGASIQVDPRGPDSGNPQVRGGGYNGDKKVIRPTYRRTIGRTTDQADDIGFRLVRFSK